MPRVGERDYARDAVWSGSHWVPCNSGLLGGLQQADSGMWMTSVGGALPQGRNRYYDQLMQSAYGGQASATTDSGADLPDADNPVLLLLGN